MLLLPPRSTLFPYTTLFRSLHDPQATRVEAYRRGMQAIRRGAGNAFILGCNHPLWPSLGLIHGSRSRSEEHTSELQSRRDLVCRLLLEKKTYKKISESGPAA